MPRIITVDPTGIISRIVRSAMDLLDLSITQVDVPSGAEALEELSRPANLVVSAFEVDENMKGFEFALRVKRAAQQTAVLILGDVDDPADFDEETAQDSPFVYLSRPVDIHQFLRVLVAGMESHEAMLNAMKAPAGGGGGGGGMTSDMDASPVPNLDSGAAQGILEKLLRDLGAMAITLSTRTGDTLLEVGASGYIDQNSLASSLKPAMLANIGIKDLIGGEVSTLQFYDGDEYDIFVLSIGLHHFISILYDGQMGARQFGSVNRYGRQAVLDLIALLGANAFFIQPPQPKEEIKRRAAVSKKVETQEQQPIHLERAEIDLAEELPPPVIEQLEPIDNLDIDKLFGSEFSLDESFFDPDKLEELAKSSNSTGQSALDWDQAQQLGILKNN